MKVHRANTILQGCASRVWAHLSVILIFISIAAGCQSGNSSDNEGETAQTTHHTSASTAEETFVQIDEQVITALNTRIAEANISSEQEVARLYKPTEDAPEGNYSYTINIQNVNHQTLELIIIEAGIPDDSVEGIKSVLTIQREGEQLRVLSIKENYRCYRGHQEWSAELCP
jgi:hypothetical protein